MMQALKGVALLGSSFTNDYVNLSPTSCMQTMQAWLKMAKIFQYWNSWPAWTTSLMALYCTHCKKDFGWLSAWTSGIFDWCDAEKHSASGPEAGQHGVPQAQPQSDHHKLLFGQAPAEREWPPQGSAWKSRLHQPRRAEWYVQLSVVILRTLGTLFFFYVCLFVFYTFTHTPSHIIRVMNTNTQSNKKG